MRKLKALDSIAFKVSAVAVAAAIPTCFYPVGLGPSVDQWLGGTLPILLGFVSAAAGIHIATLCSLYGTLGARVAERREPDAARAVSQIDGLKASALALEKDVMFLLGATAVSFGLPAIRRIHLSPEAWPFREQFLSLPAAITFSGRILDWIGLTLLILSFLVVFDTVSAIFRGHDLVAHFARHPAPLDSSRKVVEMPPKTEESIQES